MKKFMVLWMILGIFSLFAVQARAEEKSSIELGFFSGDTATSTTPIPFKIETKDSKGLRFVRSAWLEDVEYTLGVNQGNYTLSDENDIAGPVVFGDITRTTFSGTVRFRFARGRIRPYAGWGVHYTELAKSLLADGSLKTEFASGIGPVAEWGIKILLGKDFYVDVNTSQYFWSARGIRFETNVGNALVSEINISNPHLLGISIGKTF